MRFKCIFKHRRIKGGSKMGRFFAGLLSKLGFGAASTGSQACFMFWYDEPECPKSLVK